GALLLTLDINKGRPTKDIDFLAQYENLDHATAEKIIGEIVAMPVDDGVMFDPASVKCSNIREDGTINALRLRFNATLGSAREKMQIDIGYKDSVIPDPILFQYPTLLDFPAPQLKAYCWETVIAEKFEAMTKLHFLNSRLKDFYDILYLARKQPFEGKRIQGAIAGTFKKRNLSLDETPVVFTEKFMNDETKQVQWKAFLKKTGLIAEDNFVTVTLQIRQFLHPVIKMIVNGEPFTKVWDPQKFQWV
ncbi:MAG: nucleotidyl transferase AbiEii/AbiGii toxin family protein, partial [Candidatus Berkelbacteria bacterium]|nr:nucleotidyl transferase AbiEii/AbiGii toxin family protein [Candidatus Berkelbacteria bacterium]